MNTSEGSGLEMNIDESGSSFSQGVQYLSSSGSAKQEKEPQDIEQEEIEKQSSKIVRQLKIWLSRLEATKYSSLTRKEQQELALFMEVFLPNRALYNQKGQDFVSIIIQNTPSLVSSKLCSSKLVKQIHTIIYQQINPTPFTWSQRIEEKLIETDKLSTFLVLKNEKQKHFIPVYDNIEKFDQNIEEFQAIVNRVIFDQQIICFDILVHQNTVTNVDYSLSQQDQIKIRTKFDEKLHEIDPQGNLSMPLKFFAVIDEFVFEKITSSKEGKKLSNFYWQNSKKVVRLMENTVIKEKDLFVDKKMNLS